MPATYIAGYDGSPESHSAVEVAARLAEAAGAEVVAVNVYPHGTAIYWVAPTVMQSAEIEAELRASAKQTLEKLDVPGVTGMVLKADSPARGLHDQAVATGAEMIVVGTTHHGPFGRLAPGSVGMHLLHGAPCPVVAVPAECGDRPIKTIGVAYDGRRESRAALEQADALAGQLGARLVVLGASQPAVMPVAMAGGYYPADVIEKAEQAFQSMLDEAAAGTRSGAECHLLGGAPAAALVDATSDIDLLVTGSRGYGSVRGVLLGSVSRHLVDHAHCPVVVVPRPAEGE